MGVLALRSLRNVLQQVALNLHARAFRSMIRGLDQAVKVIVGHTRIVARASSSSSMNLLLIRHPTVVVGGDLEAEGALSLALIFATGSSSYIATERRLPNLLLDQLLVLLVLLHVLLEELSQVCIQLIVAFGIPLSLALLGR